MAQKSALYFIIASAVILSLLTTGVSMISPATASSKGGGSVVQVQVSTGNSGLDKDINKFYSCISKTHQDPPTIEKIDNCYYQTIGGGTNNGGPDGAGGINTGGSSLTTTAGSTNHHHKH
jgi:hypothetical protein